MCSHDYFGPGRLGFVRLADDALELANDQRSGSGRLHQASASAEAVHALDYGGRVVNAVPTWRADQQPYGGVRDSAPPRGPAYSIRR